MNAFHVYIIATSKKRHPGRIQSSQRVRSLRCDSSLSFFFFFFLRRHYRSVFCGADRAATVGVRTAIGRRGRSADRLSLQVPVVGAIQVMAPCVLKKKKKAGSAHHPNAAYNIACLFSLETLELYSLRACSTAGRKERNIEMLCATFDGYAHSFCCSFFFFFSAQARPLNVTNRTKTYREKDAKKSHFSLHVFFSSHILCGGAKSSTVFFFPFFAHLRKEQAQTHSRFSVS